MCIAATRYIYADLAHLVERDLAKVEVAGSSPVIRSIGLVVQLVRTLACHARGQGFESPSGRHFFKPLHIGQGMKNPVLLVRFRTKTPRSGNARQ